MITPEEIKHLVADPRPVILDIGCNDGEHTKMFQTIFPLGKVFSFDPEPRAHERFYRTVPNGTLFKIALGAYDGTADFYPSEGIPSPLPPAEAKAIAEKLGPGGWDFSGSLRAPKEHLRMHPWCKFGEPVKVPVMRLDTWMRNHPVCHAIDFIWADVQGAEIDLIRGGTETLKRTRYFYTEYSNRELYEGQITLQQILAMLPNFEVVTVYQEDVLLRNRMPVEWEL